MGAKPPSAQKAAPNRKTRQTTEQRVILRIASLLCRAPRVELAASAPVITHGIPSERSVHAGRNRPCEGAPFGKIGCTGATRKSSVSGAAEKVVRPAPAPE